MWGLQYLELADDKVYPQTGAEKVHKLAQAAMKFEDALRLVPTSVESLSLLGKSCSVLAETFLVAKYTIDSGKREWYIVDRKRQ